VQKLLLQRNKKIPLSVSMALAEQYKQDELVSEDFGVGYVRLEAA
jgi:hypothetical protein